jgi:hypothetical protein
MTEQRSLAAAVRSRAVDRSTRQNSLVAAACVVVPLVIVVGNWYGDGSEGVGTRITWWSVGFVFLAAAIAAVRSIRCGVFVTDNALVQRTFFFTRIVPWSRVGKFPDHPHRRISTLTCMEDGSTFRISVVGDEKSKIFRDSVECARAAATSRRDVEDWGWPPHGRHWLVVIALWVSLALMLVGAMVFDLALGDRDRYDARAARDRKTVATVTSSRIDEHEDSEGDTSYSTLVRIVFTAHDHRVVTTVERAGRYEFRRGRQLRVVYDSAHPKDADFVDQPSRDGDMSSARERLWFGGVVAVIGIVAGITFGILALGTHLRYRRMRVALRQR